MFGRLLQSKPAKPDIGLAAPNPRLQPSEIASTGQPLAQAPQEMQVYASIWYWSAPSEIALTGHSASQAPHLMHASEILYATG
jgi:hypothetical protein